MATPTATLHKPIFPHLPEGAKNYSGFRANKKHGLHPDGYTITRYGLRYLLTNLIYGGYWYNPLTGEWMPDNHLAIVPSEHLWYAYYRLSPTLPDGSPNPDCVRPSGGQYKSDLEETDGLFQGLLCTEAEHIRICRQMARHKGRNELYYHFYNYNSGIKPIHLLFLRALELDQALLPVLAAKLKNTKELEDFRQFGETLRQQQAAKTKNLRQLLAENEAEQRATEIRIDTLTQPKLLLKQQEKYKELLARHTAIQRQIEEQERPKAGKRRRILTYYELLELLGPRFERMEPGDRRIIIESTIEHVLIKVLTPRFLLVRITWFAWPAQTFLLKREYIGGGSWTDEEKLLLKQLYATASPEALLRAIPNRTWVSIQQTRKRLKLPSRWTRWEPILLPVWAEQGYCAADLAVLDHYGLDMDCPKLVEICDPEPPDDDGPSSKDGGRSQKLCTDRPALPLRPDNPRRFPRPPARSLAALSPPGHSGDRAWSHSGSQQIPALLCLPFLYIEKNRSCQQVD